MTVYTGQHLLQDVLAIQQQTGADWTPGVQTDEEDEPKRVREIVSATEHAYEAESSAWVVSLRNTDNDQLVAMSRPKDRSTNN